jgi:hypothetical protein
VERTASWRTQVKKAWVCRSELSNRTKLFAYSGRQASWTFSSYARGGSTGGEVSTGLKWTLRDAATVKLFPHTSQQSPRRSTAGLKFGIFRAWAWHCGYHGTNLGHGTERKSVSVNVGFEDPYQQRQSGRTPASQGLLSWFVVFDVGVPDMFGAVRTNAIVLTI